MERRSVIELHYITPLQTLPSIAQHGLLSHDLAVAHDHVSVASEQVQDRRTNKRVPGGMLLHQYANLYFDARNPMMYVLYKRQDCPLLAVVRLNHTVLDLPDVVISDGNAAADDTLFRPVHAGLAALDAGLVYSQDWRDDDYWTYLRKKRMRCAEVLVPHQVPPDQILGAYVARPQDQMVPRNLGWHSEVRPNVFFR